MPSVEYLLLGILLILIVGAVIAFSYCVIKPLRVHWAIIEGRKMLAAREVTRNWRHRTICRTLATAPNDLEAADLWRRLKDIQDINENWAE
jgi:hypothetical protein